MTALIWSLAALLSHWRRHPMQLGALVIGLMAATALWSGVQALNAQARASYDRAARDLGGGARLVARDPAAGIAHDAFVRLRRAGWDVSPLVEGRVEIDGRSLRVIGLDPVSAPAAALQGAFGGEFGTGTGTGAGAGPPADTAAETSAETAAGPSLGADAGAAGRGGAEPGAALLDFISPPWRAFAAPETLAALGLREGDAPAAATGRRLPPLRAAPGAPRDAVIMDVGAAQALLGREGRLSALLIGPGGPGPGAALARVAPELDRREGPAGADLARLAESFHMNLTAFGLLAFLVGLFIVHSAAGLAFEQRRATLRTLRATGVAARTLAAALVVELVGLALVAGLAGTALGYAMASALLPDVAASLHGLYGADLGDALSLRPSWWLAGMAMSVAGALAASLGGIWRTLRLPPLASAQPAAWRRAQERRLRTLGGAALGALALGWAASATLGGLIGGFALMAGVMLGAALALPVALDLALRLGGWAARGAGPIAQWAWADARQQLPGLSLALMALLLALAANVGVGTMVEGFRHTFVAWLDDRLAPELYVRASDPASALELEAWLSARPEVTAVLARPRVEIRLDGAPVELMGFADDPRTRSRWPMLEAAPDAWARISAGEGVAVSEQFARRRKAGPGDRLTLPAPGGDWPVEIVAVFADYGNPKGQIRADARALTARFPGADRRSFGLRMDPRDVPALMSAAISEPAPGVARMIDQATLKAQSMRIFERTFSVTAALNALTLAVAGAALFASLATLSAARLPQVAPLWAIGLARRDLAALELGKTLALAAATAALATPLGVAVAWVLVAVVNVEAFGWRLPLIVFPEQWLRLGALAVAVAGLAAAGPLWRLARTAPADLSKVFANER